jgi:hypothetical protein
MLERKSFCTRKTKKILFGVLWLLVFSLVNYPIGAWAGQKIYPFILGMPFSLFYFWTAYTLLIFVGILISWKLWRD